MWAVAVEILLFFAFAVCQEGEPDEKTKFIGRFKKEFPSRNCYFSECTEDYERFRKQSFIHGPIRSNFEFDLRGLPDRWKEDVISTYHNDLAAYKVTYGEERTLQGLSDFDNFALVELSKFKGDSLKVPSDVRLPSHIKKLDLTTEPYHFSNAAIDGKLNEYLGGNGTAADVEEAKAVWNGIQDFFSLWKKIYQIKWRLALERPFPPLDDVSEFAYGIFRFQKHIQQLYPGKFAQTTMYDPEKGEEVPFVADEAAYQTALGTCGWMKGSGNFVLWRIPTAAEFEKWKAEQLQKMEQIGKTPNQEGEDENDPWEGLPDYWGLLHEYTAMPEHPLFALKKEYTDAYVAWTKIFAPEWRERCARFYIRALLLRSQKKDEGASDSQTNKNPDKAPSDGMSGAPSTARKTLNAVEDNSLLVVLVIAVAALCVFVCLKMRK